MGKAGRKAQKGTSESGCRLGARKKKREGGAHTTREGGC